MLFGISSKEGHRPTGSFQRNSSPAIALGKGGEEEAGRHNPSARLSIKHISLGDLGIWRHASKGKIKSTIRSLKGSKHFDSISAHFIT